MNNNHNVTDDTLTTTTIAPEVLQSLIDASGIPQLLIVPYKVVQLGTEGGEESSRTVCTDVTVLDSRRDLRVETIALMVQARFAASEWRSTLELIGGPCDDGSEGRLARDELVRCDEDFSYFHLRAFGEVGETLFDIEYSFANDGSSTFDDVLLGSSASAPT